MNHIQPAGLLLFRSYGNAMDRALREAPLSSRVWFRQAEFQLHVNQIRQLR